MELQDITYQCCKQTFVFVIKNFTEENSWLITSEKFKIGETEEANWTLHFYPKGSTYLAKSMSLFLKYSGESPAHCSYIFSIEDRTNDLRYFDKTMMALFNEEEPQHGFKCFVKRDELFKKQKHLLENDELRIVFEVEMNEKLKGFPERDKNESKLKDLLSQRSFSDAELLAGDEVFPVHKVIVAAKSDFFFKLFSENTQQSKFEIRDVSIEVMQHVIDFIYDQKLDWAQIDLPQIFYAAKKFELNELATMCRRQMELIIDRLKKPEDISPVKNLQFLKIFLENNCLTSVRDCVGIIQTNHKSFTNLVEWKSLLQEQPNLLYYLFDFLETDSEEKVFLSQNDLTNETKLCRDYENLFLSGKHADVIFEAEGKQINVHKAIICGRSAVFDSMFNHDLQESKENIVRIEDTKFEVLRELVRFIYCDRIENIEKVAIELYSAADKYELEDLKDMCQKYLINNITADNVVEILVLADTHNQLKEMKEIAQEYFVKNIKEIAFLDLNWLISNKYELTNQIITDTLCENSKCFKSMLESIAEFDARMAALNMDDDFLYRN